MASRVNLKFVFGLGSVLVLIAIVVVYFGLRNWMAPGVEQNIERGKQAEKEGDLKKAISFYGRAVNKDRGNLDAIKVWLGAIERFTPTGRQAYEDMYIGEYTAALRAVASADRTNPAPFRRFLEERYQLTERAGSSLRGWENYSREYDEVMKNFQGNEAAKNTLRRYRGLARSGMLVANPELSEIAIREGIDDLNIAITADPKDRDAVIAISALERGLGERAARIGRQADADKLSAGVRSRLEKFVAANPDAIRVRYTLLAEDISQTVKAMSSESTSGTMLDVLKANKAGILGLAESIKSAPPEQSDAIIALGIAPWVMVTAESGMAAMDELLAHVPGGHSKNPIFLLGLARLESSRMQFDKAIALTREVVALQDKPVSIDGLLLHNLRARALQMQADASFASWEREKEQAKKDEFVAQVRELRKDLATRVGESDPSVLSIDGRLALVSGDVLGARTMISSYNDQTQQTDPTMLLIEADLLTRIGQKGAAKTKFDRVLQLDKQNIRALRSVALLEADDRNFKAAADHLAYASALLPGDAGLKEMAETARRIAERKFGNDPVVKVLVEAEEKAMGTTGDVNGAIKILRDALADPKNEGEFRLSLRLAQFLVFTKDVAGAKAVLAKSVARYPDNPGLKLMLERIDRDPLELALEEVEKASITPVQKRILRYTLYMRSSKPEEARRELAEAAKLDPDNPAVIDNQFDDALMRRDEAEQNRIIAKAEAFNLDRAGGTLYKARAMIARNKVAEAIGGFREVLNKDKLNLLAWRLLGMALLDQKRYGEAIDALKNAVDIKPDDIPSITSYLQALVFAKRESEALMLARKSENVAGADRTFFEMYLMLESSAPGGDKAKAIDARKRKIERDPDDRANKARLATLLVNSGRMPEAEALIRELRTTKPNDSVAVQIEAAYLGRQGKVAEAVQGLRDFIASLKPEERTEELYINTARLLRQLGQPEEARSTLEGARSIQDPKTALIDRELGDMLYESASGVQGTSLEDAKAKAIAILEQSLAAYQKVLDGGGVDTENAVRKRMIEVCLKAEKYDRMTEIINALPPGVQGEATILMLQGEAAAVQNDRDRALKFYDQAVAADPKDPIVYLKRGEFKSQDPRRIKDAIADYEQMIRVDAGSVMARARLLRELRKLGRDNEAIARLKECVAIEPFNEAFRQALGLMLGEMGKPLEAAQAMEDSVGQFSGSKKWRLMAAEHWARVPNWDRASEHMLTVWQDDKSVQVAVPLVEFLLNKGDVTNAFNVLMAKELAGEMDKSLPLLMLQARVLARSNRTTEAAELITRSLGKVTPESIQETSLFMSGVTGIYPKLPDQIAVLDRLEASKPFTGYVALRANSLRLRDEASKAKALRALEALTTSNTPDKVKAATWSLLGTESYSANKFEEARERFERGQKLDPDNIELCNNLAYILSVKLGKCEEALPYAQKACRGAPQNSGYLDTLGAAQLCGKKCADAIQTLGFALNAALNDTERVPVYIHLGKARLCEGDKIEARRLAGQARELMINLPAMRGQYEADLKELDRAIDSK